MRTFLCALLFSAAALAAGEHSNRRAPGFALPDSRLQVHDLADYRGKIVVIEFMKTDCPHCAPFAAVLNQVQQKYGDKVQILAVANAQQDNQNTVAAYTSGHKITYPVLFDCYQMAYSYLQSQTFDNPHVFLIDAAGFIQNDFGYGPLTKDFFEGKGLFFEIDRMLSSGAPAKK